MEDLLRIPEAFFVRLITSDETNEERKTTASRGKERWREISEMRKRIVSVKRVGGSFRW